MTRKEKVILMIGFMIGLTMLTVAVLLAVSLHESEPTVGAPKTMMLEIAEGVSIELHDDMVSFDHTNPRTATAKEPQKMHFGPTGDERDSAYVEVRSGGCLDPAKAALADLPDEERRESEIGGGAKAADLAHMLFFGALGPNEQHAYAGYCLRNSARDVVFTKLFLPIGPQCLVLTSRDHRGHECPVSDVERLARDFHIRK